MPDSLLRYALRGTEERLGEGAWQPVGTLARDVLNRLSEPPTDVVRALAEAMASLQQPRPLPSFVGALTDALSRMQPPNPAHMPPVAGAIARALESAARHLAIRRVVRHLAQHPADLPRGMLRRAVQWIGPADGADLFEATPEGAVLLSGVYGVDRGRLRVCEDCQVFVVFPRHRWKGRYCEDCRDLRAGCPREGVSPRLAVWKADRWRKVQDRMRNRGFARLAKQLGQTELTDEQRTAWKQMALGRLRQVKNPQELREWEQDVAPLGQPGYPKGRPRKLMPTRRQKPGGDRDARAHQKAYAHPSRTRVWTGF